MVETAADDPERHGPHGDRLDIPGLATSVQRPPLGHYRHEDPGDDAQGIGVNR